MNAPALLSVQSLSYQVPGRRILEDVSLEVRSDQFVGIIGPNGGGKTTLLKLMLRLLPPSAGQVCYRDAQTRVGYVPQFTAANQRMPVRVASVVAMGADEGGFATWQRRARLRQRVRQVLAQLQIGHLYEAQYDALSGGQKQRVLIARALVSQPQLLLFDEPTASIDPSGTQCFYELLQSLRGQLSVVLVSHELSVLANYFDSLVCVNQRVIQHHEGHITEQMGRLLFGEHTSDCPMECYSKDFSQFVDLHQHHAHS